MEITWFGHANFRYRHGDTDLFVDPFFVGNPSAPVTYDQIAKADVILVTHDHTDHVGQALELAIRLDAEVVGVHDTIQNLIAQGLPESLGVPMNIGGTVERGGVKIKMVQALHSSITGTAVGFILTMPDNRCIYHAGDTGLFGDMELFSRFNDIDIAALPIGGRFTMDAQEAAYACKLLKCNTVIPMHWGTWPILAQNTEAFDRELKKTTPDTKILHLEIGKPKEI
ncbi:metal-dependent hydrolase [Salidesulfovibrio onnuriiensis]|uniref:metal-dependent hydrolase n=1 Tax=Salidesulfovibrio onnuriiensis TaxID=2583823 RepID=UPI0011C7CC20|nr:metal-dependent hydrolase [Salidesulfovibrio onnuriiensis]